MALSQHAVDCANDTIELLDLGLRPYAEVWSIQRERQRALIDGKGEEALIVCEHHPVITLGRSTKADSLLVARESLAANGVELFEVERGGDATFHAPGQIVAYPLIDLSRRKRDVGWYMRRLERVILETLAEFGIEGLIIQGKTGVWTTPKGNDIQCSPYKVASLGVRISRWCTLHGLSLNVTDCSWGFSFINPCGFKDIKITSMREAAASQAIEVAEVKASLIENFVRLFEIKTGDRS